MKKKKINDCDKKFIFISMPMADIQDDKIIKKIEKVQKKLDKKYFSINNFFHGDVFYIDAKIHYINMKHRPLYYLASALCLIGTCDAIYMCKGWEKARGCRIEHEVAKEYGLKIIYEKKE